MYLVKVEVIVGVSETADDALQVAIQSAGRFLTLREAEQAGLRLRRHSFAVSAWIEWEVPGMIVH